MVSSILTHLRHSLSLLVCLVAATAVNAAEPARGAASAPTPRTPPLLTPTQLRDCMATKERLHAQTDDALKDKAAIEADKAEIARTGDSLGEQVATLDKTSGEQAGGFGNGVDVNGGEVDEFAAFGVIVAEIHAGIDHPDAVETLLAKGFKAEAVQATKDGYEKTCELRRYDERDLNDLKRKK